MVPITGRQPSAKRRCMSLSSMRISIPCTQSTDAASTWRSDTETGLARLARQRWGLPLFVSYYGPKQLTRERRSSCCSSSTRRLTWENRTHRYGLFAAVVDAGVDDAVRVDRGHPGVTDLVDDGAAGGG